MSEYKLLLEDSDSTNYAKLLISKSNSRIQFANGSNNWKNFNNEFLFLFDLSPDNHMSWILCKRLIDSGRKVLPILCSEYHIIRAFIGYCDKTRLLLNFGKYRDVSKCTTYERYCKEVLKNFQCLIPKVDPKVDFYLSVCFCLNCKNDYLQPDLEIKYKRLINTIPGVYVNFDYTQYFSWFEYVCNKYQKFGYCVDTPLMSDILIKLKTQKF